MNILTWKKSFRKPIAVLLALVLSITVFLPCFAGTVVLAETTEEEDIAALKEAWGEMYGTTWAGYPYHYPNVYYKTSTDLTDTEGVETSNVTVGTAAANGIDITDIDNTNSAKLGTMVAKYNVSCDYAVPANTNLNTVLFTRYNYSNSTAIVNRKDYTVYQDACIYMKVVSVEHEGSLAPCVSTLTSAFGYQVNANNRIYITEEDVGKWQKIDIADFVFDDTNSSGVNFADWQTSLTGVNYLALQAYDYLDAEIIFGGVVGYTAVTVPTDLTTMSEWLVAADALDISANGGTEKFTALVNQFKLKYAETYGAAILKAAWESADNSGITLDDTSAWTINDWITNITAYEVEGKTFNDRFTATWELYKQALPEEFGIAAIKNAWGKAIVPGSIALVPKYYNDSTGTQTAPTLEAPYTRTLVDWFTATNSLAVHKDLENFTDAAAYTESAAGSVFYTKTNTGTNMKSDFTIADPSTFPDMYVFFKIENVEVPGKLSAGMMWHITGSPTAARRSSGWTYEFDENTTEDWQMVSFTDIVNAGTSWISAINSSYGTTDWREVIKTGNSWSQYLRNVSFQLNGTDAKADVTFGPMVTGVYATLPTEITDWTLSDWVFNAKEFLETETVYGGKEALEEAIAAATALDYELRDAVALKDTLSANYVAPITALVPFCHYDTSNSNITDYSTSVTNGRTTLVTSTEDNADYYGSRYTTVTLKDTASRTATTADSVDALIIRADSTTVNRGFNFGAYPKVDDIYVYYRITSVTNPGKMGVSYRSHSQSRIAATGWYDTIEKADAEGVYRKVSLADMMCGSGYGANFASKCADGSTSFNNASWYNLATICQLQSLEFQPVGGAEFTIEIGGLMFTQGTGLTLGDNFADIYTTASTFDNSAYVDPDANEDTVGDFTATLTAINAAKQSGDATGDGKVNVLDILRLKRYMAAAENVKIYKWAADVDGDDSITAADATAIQNAILGITTE